MSQVKAERLARSEQRVRSKSASLIQRAFWYDPHHTQLSVQRKAKGWMQPVMFETKPRHVRKIAASWVCVACRGFKARRWVRKRLFEQWLQDFASAAASPETTLPATTLQGKRFGLLVT